jgi:integration host factor subunit beta
MTGMTKSELIDRLADRQKYLSIRDIDTSVKLMLEEMINAMARGERIEIRGFGSFSLNFRQPRIGRNPKSGESVSLESKHVPHFKPGKELRERVNEKAGQIIRNE